MLRHTVKHSATETLETDVHKTTNGRKLEHKYKTYVRLYKRSMRHTIKCDILLSEDIKISVEKEKILRD